MDLRLIIFLYVFFTPLHSSNRYFNRRSKRQELGTGSVPVNPAIASNPAQQMPPVNPPAVVNSAPNPVVNSVPVNAAVVPNPDQPIPIANAGGVISPVQQAAVPVNPAVVPINSAQPVPPLSSTGIVSPVQQASPGQVASGSVQVNPVTVPIPAQPVPPANPAGVVNPAPSPVEPNVVPVNPALSPVGSNSVPVNPAVIPVPPQPQPIAPAVNPSQQVPPNPVVSSSVPVNPAVVPIPTQEVSPVNPIGVTSLALSPSPAQQQPSSSLSTDSVSIKPDTETLSSSSETSDSESGDDNSYYDEEDLSCYSKCVGLTSDAPITIDSNLKYDAEVKQTDLSSTCPLYQSAKTCMNDCPTSSSVSNFNEIYKLTTFLCVDRLTDANRYFSCTLNDKRDYQDECDSDTTKGGNSTVQPDDSQDTESDVTIYCKNQRCMMKKKMESVQQSCPDILPFARNYFKLDIDITESTQEYGALWTTECINLQKNLETNVPL